MKELLFYNGDIITMEEGKEAEAVLVRDGVIVKAGKKEQVEQEASKETQRIDLDGKTLIPAFIDAHSHFSGYAVSLLEINLENAKSYDDIINMVQKFIKENHVPKGEWVQATGYDHNNLIEQKHPSKELLDKASPENPLLIKHVSNHMGVLNSLGLEKLNITDITKDPEGGKIFKENGEPTGYLEEKAFVNATIAIPMVTMEKLSGALLKTQECYASYGITTAQEGYVVKELGDIIQLMMATNMLKIDLVGYVDFMDAPVVFERFPNAIKQYDHHFKIGGYKTFLDGSPQGRTAWMLAPYENGEEGYVAYGTQTDEQILEKIETALKDDMQLLVHCNGDAASDQYIRQYAKAKEQVENDKEIRPVIIHAQLLAKDQLGEVKELHMIPSFFVAHVYHWGDVHIKNFGLERAKEISPANSALKEDILFTFHQDSPIIQPNMLETIWCACKRETKNGILLGEDERISPYEALKAVTINAAYQYFEEEKKGSIKENKVADLVILDKNPLKIDIDEIRNIKVVETFKEGTSIFKRNSK